MKIWILVYSPATNDNLIKLMYFKFSTDLERFVLASKDSIIVYHYECLDIGIKFEVEGN